MTLKNKVKSGIRMLTPPTKLGKIYALAALISTPIAGTLGLELYTSKYHPKENPAYFQKQTGDGIRLDD